VVGDATKARSRAARADRDSWRRHAMRRYDRLETGPTHGVCVAPVAGGRAAVGRGMTEKASVERWAGCGVRGARASHCSLGDPEVRRACGPGTICGAAELSKTRSGAEQRVERTSKEDLCTTRRCRPRPGCCRFVGSSGRGEGSGFRIQNPGNPATAPWGWRLGFGPRTGHGPGRVERAVGRERGSVVRRAEAGGSRAPFGSGRRGRRTRAGRQGGPGDCVSKRL
jgi:hypothetical protein